MFWRQHTQRTLQCELEKLEPHARQKNCACECVQGECTDYTSPSLTRESPLPVSETPCNNSKNGNPPTLRRSTRIVVKLTMFAKSSAVLLDDVLGMASVESGSSAGSEDCLVVQLAVASS